MDQILTLTEFLEYTGARLTYYDMGRRVSIIPTDDFLAFEKTDIPYPYPMQQRAWFCLVQQRPDDADSPLIWFLRFGLDEQGKLVQAERDYFINRFVEIANQHPDQKQLAQVLEDNPCTFRPGQQKMANVHAILACALGRSPSQYFAHALEYFAGHVGWDQWKFVGLQGIADLAARQRQHPIGDALAESVPELPAEPLIALCQCLENHALLPHLADALYARLQAGLSRLDIPANELAALLRGMAHAPQDLLEEALLESLANPVSAHPEVLAAIGGRLWQTLHSPEVASAFLLRLASEQVPQTVFDHCLGDLLRMPGLQQPLLQVLRSPDRPDELATAFQAMLDG